MSSRFDNIQSRSIYVGASTNPDPALGDLGIDGNLGVGTPTPVSAISIYRGVGTNAYIEVSGNGNALASTSMVYGQDSGNNGYAWNRANAPVIFGTQNTERMRITSGGNIGIGTTNPSAIIHVSAGDSSYALFGPNTTYGGSLRVGAGPASPSNTVAQVIASDGNLHLDSGTGQLTYINYYSSTNTLINSNGGYVGIGTASPGAKLTLRTSNSSYGESLRITDGIGVMNIGHWDGTNNRFEFYGKPTLFVQYGSSNPLLFGTEGNERMRITPTGNVGIGTTAPIASLDNQGSLGTYRQKGLTTMVTDILYADGTNATRYEIARATIDYNDWNETGVIEIELYEKYYSDGLKKRYLVTYGWSAGANKYLVEMSGTGANNFQVTIGSPVIISGDIRYLPIYVDLRYYSRCIASVKSNRNLTTNTTPWVGEISFNNAPSMTYISDFSADSAVYAGNVLGGNTLFPSGNVGIGTTAPAYKLDVNGDVKVGSYLYMASEGSGAVLGDITTGNYLRFLVSNSEKMRITSGGNVGIGTTNPIHPLSVVGKIGGNIFSDSHLEFLSNGNTSLKANDDVYLGYAQSTVIKQSGNVGIGTVSPAARLHVVSPDLGFTTGNTSYNALFYSYTGNASFLEIKDVRTSNGSDWTSVGKRLQMRVDSTYMGYMQFNGNSNNYGISFGIGGTTTNPGNVDEAMRITNSGNVGIGTTSPATKLHVSGTIDTRIRLSDTGGSYMELYQQSTDSYVIVSNALRFYNGGSESIHIASSGNVGIGTTSPGAKLDVSAGTNLNLGIQQLSLDNFSNDGIGITFSRTSSDADLMALGVADSDKLGLFSRSGIIFATGGSTFYSATSEVMRITDGGNVGIGTSSPLQRLDVSNGGIGFSGVGLNASDKKLYSPTDGDLEWMTHNQAGGHGFAVSHQGTKIVYLNTSGNSYLNGGNVGIGTTSPLAKLSVGYGSIADPNIAIQISSEGSGTQKWIGINKNNGYGLIIGYIETGGLSGNGAYIRQVTTDPLHFTVNSTTTAMSIVSSGNIGIGTTSPGARLEIYGSGSTGSTAALTVRNAVGTKLVNVFDDGLIQLNNLLNINQAIYINSGNSNRHYALESHIFNVVDSSFQRIDFVTIQGNLQSPAMGVGTMSPERSAILDVTSRSKGFLPPRMTNTEMNAISSPAAGLVVYDTSNNKLTVYNGSTWVPLH